MRFLSSELILLTLSAGMSWYFIAFFVAVGHALRAPIAPALPGYPKSRLLGVLPSFRRDAAGCLAAHASYCRREGLDAVALNMGLLGTFTLVVGAEQVASVFEDRESVMFKSAIDRRGVGLLTGIGVLLADGKEHTRKRRLVLPSFDARRLTAYVETMSDISKQVADELLGAADAAPPGGAATFEASNTMSSAALRIVGLCLFSSDPAGGSDAATKDFGSALEECLEHTAWISRSALPPPKWLPTRRNRRFWRNLRVLDSFVYGLIEERRSALSAEGGARGGDGQRGDLLDMLLSAQVVDEEAERAERDEAAATTTGLSTTEVRDEAMTLLLAGHETSALALTWCLHFLSSDEMAGWRDEIAEEGRALLRHGATPARLEEQMPRTRAALCEALRLRPPAWAFDREVQRAVELPGGLELRKREILLLSPFVQHQDPRVFAEPHRFDPSRFMSEAGELAEPWDGGYDRFEYIPFGQGRRRCIGYRFARWEMLVILATLLARVEVTRPSDYSAPPMEGSVTLRPATEFELVVSRRASA